MNQSSNEPGPNDSLSLVHLIRPPSVATDGPAPSLLLLHGQGADEADLAPLAGSLDPRLFVVSARGWIPFSSGYRWFASDSPDTLDRSSLLQGVDRVSRFVAEITDAYRLDPERRFVLGFSNGAGIASALALTKPGLLAGAILCSGIYPFQVDLGWPDDLENYPTFVAHGDLDPLLSVDIGRAARRWLEDRGASVEYHEYPIPHAISPDELTDVDNWLKKQLG